MSIRHRVPGLPSGLRLIYLVCVALAPLDGLATFTGASVLGFQLSLFRLAVLVAVGATIIRAVLTQRVTGFAGSTALYLLTLWTAWSLVSGLWTGHPEDASRMALLIAFAYLLVLMCICLEKTRDTIKSVGFILAATVIFGLIEEFTGWRLPASRLYYFSNEITAFYFNPTYMAASLALMFPWCMNGVLRSRPKPRFLWLLLCPVVVYLIVRTGTKGNLLAVILEVAAFALLSLQRRVFLQRYILAMCVTGLVIWLVVTFDLIPSVLLQKIGELGSVLDARSWLSGEGSFGSRLTLWRAGLSIAAPNILWGSGIGTVVQVSANQVYSIHNFWLEALVGSGILGLMLLVAMYVVVVWGMLRLSIGGAGAANVPILVALVGFVPISLTVGSVSVLWVFWVTLGMAIGRIESASKGHSQELPGPVRHG